MTMSFQLHYPVETTGLAQALIALPDAGLRLMADSADPRFIPDAFNTPDHLVAPYADGRYKWPRRQLRRFTDAKQVPITVTGDLGVPIADVERGDMTPEDFADWLAGRLDRDEHWHALYSSIDTLPEVRAAVALRGINPLIFGWWAANPTGLAHIYPGSAATQYLWVPGQYDVSAVTRGWHPETHGAWDAAA